MGSYFVSKLKILTHYFADFDWRRWVIFGCTLGLFLVVLLIPHRNTLRSWASMPLTTKIENSCQNHPASGDQQSPTIVFHPANDLAVGEKTPITIQFNESMDPRSLSLDGDLALEAKSPQWKMSQTKDDTLVLEPQGVWTHGASQTLVISASDLSGNYLLPTKLIFQVGAGIYYVHPQGSDKQAGSPEAPFRTLHFAIEEARTHYNQASIHVSAGVYEVERTLGLREGISLYGGFDPHNWNHRDVHQFSSHILDKRKQGGTYLNPIETVYLTGSGGYLYFDGFTVEAGEGQYTAALTTSNSWAATFSNNVFIGGRGKYRSMGVYKYNDVMPSVVLYQNTLEGGEGGQSYGIYATGSGQIIANRIRGGQGSTSYGVYCNSLDRLLVEQNFISGGSGQTSYGIYTRRAGVQIAHNKIHGGNGQEKSFGIYAADASSPYPSILENTIEGGHSIQSHGIYVFGSEPLLELNRINGGFASQRSVGVFLNATNLKLRSNLIFGGESWSESVGVWVTNPSHPLVEHNTISGGSGGAQMGGANQSSALFVSTSSPRIKSNQLFTSGGLNRYCAQFEKISSMEFTQNALFDCTNPIRIDSTECASSGQEGLASICSVEDVNKLKWASGNQTGDPFKQPKAALTRRLPFSSFLSAPPALPQESTVEPQLWDPTQSFNELERSELASEALLTSLPQ